MLGRDMVRTEIFLVDSEVRDIRRVIMVGGLVVIVVATVAGTVAGTVAVMAAVMVAVMAEGMVGMVMGPAMVEGMGLVMVEGMTLAMRHRTASHEQWQCRQEACQRRVWGEVYRWGLWEREAWE